MFQDRITRDDERHQVLIDNRDGLFLLFVDSRQLGQAQPAVPHWVREAADEHSLHVMIRWFGARRHQWQEWGELAGTIGHEAFGQVMERLMKEHPPLEVTGYMLQATDAPAEIAIGEVLHGGTAEILYRHRFGSPDMRDHFFNWFNEGENFQQVEALVQLGYSEGTIALGQALNDLAASGSHGSATAVDGPLAA